MAAKRRRWRGWQGFMDPARFVFLDETSAATNMARRYGRCPATLFLLDDLSPGFFQMAGFRGPLLCHILPHPGKPGGR